MARKKLEGEYFNDTDLRSRDLKSKKGIIGKSHGTDTIAASKGVQMGLNDKKIAKSSYALSKRATQVDKNLGKAAGTDYRFGTTKKSCKCG